MGYTAIQKNQGEGWQWMGIGYTGLTEDEARAEIKELRKESRGTKYRIINVTIVPQ